ncbi:MAG: hypothetical protein QM635_11625 [Microbacteriaceae bacterium]
MALAERGTHAIFDAVTGPYTTSESALSSELLRRLTPGMLCPADQGFYSFAAWNAASATGADLLWRVRDNRGLEPLQDLPDGSDLAEVFDSKADRKRAFGSARTSSECRLDAQSSKVITLQSLSVHFSSAATVQFSTDADTHPA